MTNYLCKKFQNRSKNLGKKISKEVWMKKSNTFNILIIKKSDKVF